jgi:glucose-6-phosphate isomerase
MEMLRYDPSAVFLDGTGLSRSDLAALAPRLNAARDEVLGEAEAWAAHAPVPKEKDPLDAGFIDLPRRLLQDYQRDEAASELGRIVAAADSLRELVDRVVILGIGGSCMGARALFEACCHAYHNELPRTARRDRKKLSAPRIYFEGNNVDNDAASGLLELLGRSGSGAQRAQDRWALVVISKSGGTLETAVAFRLFRSALERACAPGSDEWMPRLVVPITGAKGRLRELAQRMRCQHVFDIPDGVGGRFSIFTAVGLLPAAIMGLDVVALLEGAAEMTQRFREAPPGENPVLDYVGISHLLEARRGLTTRVLSVWSKGLEAVGLWYDQLLSESLGKQRRPSDGHGEIEYFGATPMTVVNTRDLHSRGQQHQEGRRDKLITNVVVDHVRREPLRIEPSELDEDRLNELRGNTLPEIMAAAVAGTNKAYRDDCRPTADLHLPRQDEASLGQFFQMMMLATVAEGRLIGVNPYGQPGVEAYKLNMNAILRGKGEGRSSSPGQGASARCRACGGLVRAFPGRYDTSLVFWLPLVFAGEDAGQRFGPVR